MPSDRWPLAHQVDTRHSRVAYNVRGKDSESECTGGAFRVRAHRARCGAAAGFGATGHNLDAKLVARGFANDWGPGGSPGRSRRSPMPFETDIKPLFRESDRQSMQAWLDLWSYDDVRDHAWDTLERVEAGEMACDEPWEEQKVQTLGTWIEHGCPP
jgi:hypothetical protein